MMTPFSQQRQCRATTKAGHRCPNDANPSGLCHVHDPALQCGAQTKRGTRCTVATGGGRCKTHVEAAAAPRPAALWEEEQRAPALSMDFLARTVDFG